MPPQSDQGRLSSPLRVFTKVLVGWTVVAIATVLWPVAAVSEHVNQAHLFQTNVVRNEDEFLIGVGIGDITGPIVETNMMGYANLGQTDVGLHMRQRARAFIVADPADPRQRVVYVNADVSCGDTAIRRGILTQLEELYPGVYSEANVAIVGTHSHAGAGGYLHNFLPQFTSIGFVRETYLAIVEGTVKAISEAHSSMTIGRLSIGNTTVPDASINRSPSAYLANPESERARYETDVDREMSLIKFEDLSGKPLGFLSFFAVHGTSLYNNNTLVSGDNKGLAAYLYETLMEPDATPGKTDFVAGFSQSASGDVSPNTLGAFCESPGKPWHGQPCHFETSTCGNWTQDCRGRGPGFRVSDFRSNEIIATKQFDAAQVIMNSESESLMRLKGPVRGLHRFTDMSKHTFISSNGTTVTTCPAALGYSFAGGTTDGPGAFDFIQGTTSDSPRNPLWETIKWIIAPQAGAKQAACHYPKPILLNVGYLNFPYQWSPSVVDIQLLRIGQLVMLIIPGEFTTMSGRRLREAVRAKLVSEGIVGTDAYVIAVGPGNSYSHYTTTREEYAVQRYEGASVLYGPNQLDAYIDLYTNLTTYLKTGGSPPTGPIPEDLTPRAVMIRAGVTADGVPSGRSFGHVLEDVESHYTRGQTVYAVFQAANPRNNLRLESTFLTVDWFDSSTGEWEPVRTDSHPSTIFKWKRTNTVFGRSVANVSWTIEDDAKAGTYRLTYYGDAKAWIGNTITPFSGSSSTFEII